MKNLLAIICVLLPSAFLAIQTRVEYNESIKLTIGNVIVLLLMFLYVFLIIYFGANWVDGSGKHIYSGKYRSLPFFYILPGIVIGIILFPKSSVKLVSSIQLPFNVNSFAPVFKFLGWVALIFLIIFNILYRSI